MHFLTLARHFEDFSGYLEVSGTFLSVIIELQHIFLHC